MREDRYTYFDYQEIVRKAEMERSMALGEALADGVLWIGRTLRTLFAALARGVTRPGDRGSVPMLP